MGKRTKGKRWYWLSFYSTRGTAKRRSTKAAPQPFWSWVTGETFDEPTRFTIVCLIEDVADEAAAWALVREWWSDVGDVRFCDEVARGYNPGDRFAGYVPPPEFAGGAR